MVVYLYLHEAMRNQKYTKALSYLNALTSSSVQKMEESCCIQFRLEGVNVYSYVESNRRKKKNPFIIPAALSNHTHNVIPARLALLEIHIRFIFSSTMTDEFQDNDGSTIEEGVTGEDTSHRSTPSYFKGLPITICIGIVCLVFYIWVANDYFPTRKWESIEGTINTPCLVEYEIDGQLYTFESNFNCEKLGPYKLKYNPEDPSDAMSAGFQDQSRIMLIVSGCLAPIFIFGIPFAMCATFLCRRYDIGPMLERTFERIFKRS